MATRLKIDLSSGTLDVEGSEKFVNDIYKEFKERLDGSTNNRKKRSTGSKKKKPGRKKMPPYQPKVVKELELSPKNAPSLKDFYKGFKKMNRNEKFLVYIKYLKDHAGVKKVTMDHLYTCMKHVGDRIPNLFKQTLSNAKNKTGWLSITNPNNIKITAKGNRYYEGELMKKAAKK